MIRSSTGSQDSSAEKMIKEHIDIRFDAYHLVLWVSENFSPEDVFDDRYLSDWAEENGYVKE
jgi:hypothetical protein